MSDRIVFDELRSAVSAFICQPGISVELEPLAPISRVFTKGGSQSVCTVKLEHGQIYNVEFVYKFWVYLLENMNFPCSPLFMISNNGLALTLKCFITEPRDIITTGERVQPMSSDVDLVRNANVVMGQDDFLKFKSAMVYNSDLDVFNSMVVCRTYITERRQSLQFFVVKPKNHQRLQNVLDLITVSSRYQRPLSGRRLDVTPAGATVSCHVTPRRPLRLQRSSSASSASSFTRLGSSSDSDSSSDREGLPECRRGLRRRVRDSRNLADRRWGLPWPLVPFWKRTPFYFLIAITGPLLVLSVWLGTRYFRW